MIYVKECSVYVFLEEVYGIWSYIQVFNPFEFIFVYGFRECSNFILLHIAPLIQETCLFSVVYFCLLCHTLISHKYVGLFLGSLLRSLDLCVCFYASAILFWLTVALQCSLKPGSLIPPALLLFLKIALVIHVFQYKF